VPQRLEGGGQATESFRRLLCAIDFSEASLTGLDYALALARAFAASVILLHAVEDLADSPVAPWSFGMPELRTMLQDEASQRLARLIPADAREWCRVESMAGDLEAHHEIMRVARDAWADLIVMGVHGRSCLGARLLGSTTLRVLEQASCPVLTVRPASEAKGR
jgi:nucleotide-binding universal stress UspA family protein